MNSAFDELYKEFGFDDGITTRDDLSEVEERRFVDCCFSIDEEIGFAETFGTSYTGERKYLGMKFKVLDRVPEIKDDPDKGAELSCLPMWNIELENGDRIVAYPEEICLSER